MPSSILLALALAGVNPAKIPSHVLFADDGAKVEVEGSVAFALVGNTTGETTTPVILKDIAAAANKDGGPRFVVLLGDMVDQASTSGWTDFDKRFDDLLDGATLQDQPGVRVPAIPVAGTNEGAGDPGYVGLGAAFPGIGQDIGYNRVATWYAYDVLSAGHAWRFVVLDADRKRLGSRWDEQLRWLKGAVEGDYTGMIVLMHDSLFNATGNKASLATDANASALLQALDAEIDERKLKVVFSAGNASTEVFQPGGPLTTLYVNAGGGGAPVGDVLRQVRPPEGKGGEPLSLESNFDATLSESLARWNRAAPVDPAVMDKARGAGDFEGLAGRVDGAAAPTWGWWMARIDGPNLTLNYRIWTPDGTLEPAWTGTVGERTGWVITP